MRKAEISSFVFFKGVTWLEFYYRQKKKNRRSVPSTYPDLSEKKVFSVHLVILDLNTVYGVVDGYHCLSLF